jgi:hypothetical protein
MMHLYQQLSVFRFRQPCNLSSLEPQDFSKRHCHRLLFQQWRATNVTKLEVDGAAVSGIGSHWLVESNYVENCQRGFEIECFSSNLKHDIRIQKNTLTNILEKGIMLFATCQDTNVAVNFSDITIAHNN